MRIRVRKTPPKPNLTSVMDAVFIFIFFLLMSAQFLQIHTIHSDAPAISLVKEESKDLPLNLKLEINSQEIRVKTGLDSNLSKKFEKRDGVYDLKALRDYVIDLKKKYVDESTVTISPESSVNYEQIVKVIDSVRELKPSEGVIQVKNKKGVVVRTNKLFDQVVFEAQ